MSIFNNEDCIGFYCSIFNILDVFGVGVDIYIHHSIYGNNRKLLG
jgi:hypothetical protein